MGELFSTYMKIGGWHYRIKSIGYMIAGLIFSIIGLVYYISSKQPMVLFIFVLGLLLLIAGIFMWFRAKRFIKGKVF